MDTSGRSEGVVGAEKLRRCLPFRIARVLIGSAKTNHALKPRLPNDVCCGATRLNYTSPLTISHLVV